MRRIELPLPRPVRALHVGVPRGHAWRQYGFTPRTALETLAWEAAELEESYSTGWSVWWLEEVATAPAPLSTTIWFNGDDGGGRARDAFLAVLREVGFAVEVGKEATIPDLEQAMAFVGLMRNEGVVLGPLVHRDYPMGVQEHLTRPYVEQHFDFEPQDCPGCGEHIQPRLVDFGTPSESGPMERETFDEVWHMGSMVPPGNAVCIKCRHFFQIDPPSR